MIKFIESKGNIYVVGDLIDTIAKYHIHTIDKTYINNQQIRDNNSYHITFILKSDINKPTSELLNELNNSSLLNEEYILHYGMGRLTDNNNECYYQLIYWSLASDWLLSNNYPQKDFHVTIGFKFNDIFKQKNINSLFDPIASSISTFQNYKTVADIDMFLSIVSDVNLQMQKVNLLQVQHLYLEAIHELKPIVKSDTKLKIKLIQLYKKLIHETQNDHNLIDYHYNILLTVLSINPLTTEQTNFLLTEKQKMIDYICTNIIVSNKERERYKFPVTIESEPVNLPRYTSWIIPGYLGGCALPNQMNRSKFLRI